jgi:hypothetical protein
MLTAEHMNVSDLALGRALREALHVYIGACATPTVLVELRNRAAEIDAGATSAQVPVAYAAPADVRRYLREQDGPPLQLGPKDESRSMAFYAAPVVPASHEAALIDKRSTGLYEKFRVERTDGSSAPGAKHCGCDYFVLDLTHDAHAMPALRAYADSCATSYPALAADLRAKLPMLKAFACSDSDLYAAESAEQAAVLYEDMSGKPPNAEDGYPYELTDAELDARQPAFDENKNRIEGQTTSVREMLAEHGNEPGWLAGSDW